MYTLDYKSALRWNKQLVRQTPHMTIQNYLWALQVFCEWTGKTPDELIRERLFEIYAEIEFSKTQTFSRIEKYQQQDKSKTKHSKDMIIKALTSFYESNEANIN